MPAGSGNTAPSNCKQNLRRADGMYVPQCSNNHCESCSLASPTTFTLQPICRGNVMSHFLMKLFIISYGNRWNFADSHAVVIGAYEYRDFMAREGIATNKYFINFELRENHCWNTPKVTTKMWLFVPYCCNTGAGWTLGQHLNKNTINVSLILPCLYLKWIL